MWDLIDLQGAEGDEKRIRDNSLEHHTGWRGWKERGERKGENIFSEKQGRIKLYHHQKGQARHRLLGDHFHGCF